MVASDSRGPQFELAKIMKKRPGLAHLKKYFPMYDQILFELYYVLDGLETFLEICIMISL